MRNENSLIEMKFTVNFLLIFFLKFFQLYDYFAIYIETNKYFFTNTK